MHVKMCREQFHIDFNLSILVCLVLCFLSLCGFNIKCVDGNAVSSLRDGALGTLHWDYSCCLAWGFTRGKLRSTT